MAKKPPRPLIREDISGKTEKYRFHRQEADGSLTYLGEIELVYKHHVRQNCWEATGPDGHLWMHDREDQAIKALEWDRKGYPLG